MEIIRRRRFEQYSDMIARLYPELSVVSNNNDGTGKKVLSRTVTFQVTDNCNLACKYCYQINKGKRKMSFEVAKKFVDLLLSGEKGFSDYVNPEISPALIIEFIGGEPFMEVELIDQICDYFFKEAIRLDHPWAMRHCISICSNGVLYTDPRVQRFLWKHRDNLSFSVTIDGNKELHDSCRVFHDGSPSYDIAVAAAKDWMDRGHYMGSKITIAPGNITYLYDAIVHMIDLGYDEIHANCVYEEGWELHHATELYWQMKRIADYMLDHNLELNTAMALFEDNFFRPKHVDDLDNWCGGTGSMLSCDPDGYLYPCIRYMESSLGCDRPPLRIGSVDEGLGLTDEHTEVINCLNCVNRRSESTDECFYCPIAEGCSWCSAYNYQVNGTPDSRVTYICIMHKARAIANAYFWSKVYVKHNVPEEYELFVPTEWALEIIPAEEWDMILSLPKIVHRTDPDYIKQCQLPTKPLKEETEEMITNEVNS